MYFLKTTSMFLKKMNCLLFHSYLIMSIIGRHNMLVLQYILLGVFKNHFEEIGNGINSKIYLQGISAVQWTIGLPAPWTLPGGNKRKEVQRNRGQQRGLVYLTHTNIRLRTVPHYSLLNLYLHVNTATVICRDKESLLQIFETLFEMLLLAINL